MLFQHFVFILPLVKRAKDIDEFRSSCPEVFYKKDALKNFGKFAGKQLCQSLFFNNVDGMRPVTLLKKRFRHSCLTVSFAKFLRTPFL